MHKQTHLHAISIIHVHNYDTPVMHVYIREGGGEGENKFGDTRGNDKERYVYCRDVSHECKHRQNFMEVTMWYVYYTWNTLVIFMTRGTTRVISVHTTVRGV